VFRNERGARPRALLPHRALQRGRARRRRIEGGGRRDRGPRRGLPAEPAGDGDRDARRREHRRDLVVVFSRISACAGCSIDSDRSRPRC
jgi:hypothetical protein